MIQIDELVFSYRGRCVYDGMSLELKDGAVYGSLEGTEQARLPL